MRKKVIFQICILVLAYCSPTGVGHAQSVTDEQEKRAFVSAMPSADVIVFTDAGRLFNEVLPRFIPEPILPQVKAALGQMKDKLGVDFGRIKYGSAATRFIKTGSGEVEAQTVNIIKGPSAASSLMDFLISQFKAKARQQTHGSKTLYVFKPEETAPDSRDVAFVALDADSLAFGSTALVRAAIDAREGRGRIDPAAVDRLFSGKDPLLSATGKVPPNMLRDFGLAGMSNVSEVDASLSSATSFYLTVGMTPEVFDISASFQMPGPEQAQRLSELLKSFADAAVGKIKARVFRDLFESRSFVAQGSEVIAKVSIQQERIASIFKGVMSEPASVTAVRGGEISSKEAAGLESKLKENPNDLTARALLLGYYQHKQTQAGEQARQRHALWIIENHPQSDIAGDPTTQAFFEFDVNFYSQARTIWLKQVEAHKNDTAVISNAADFFLRYENGIAERLLKQLAVLEPDNYKWPERLAYLYSLELQSAHGASRAAAAAKSLQKYEQALSLADDSERGYLLDDLAQMAFDAGDMVKTKAYATELLDKHGREADGSPDGDAIFNGNQVLGRVALRNRDIAKARMHLIESAKNPGSPVLGSYGPDMTLAKELLEKGEKAAVLKYLRLCAGFWRLEGGRLKRWEAIIRRGRIPDFKKY